jgi:hypothetical protein
MGLSDKTVWQSSKLHGAGASPAKPTVSLKHVLSTKAETILKNEKVKNGRQKTYER